MKHLKMFKNFINEGSFDSLGLSKMKVFSKAMADPFIKSILPDIEKMMDANLKDQKSWIDEYTNIFRKSCEKFGGAKKDDIEGTCNKSETIQKLIEYFLDPAKGLLDTKTLDRWLTTEADLSDPATKISDIDKYVTAAVDILKKTGVSDGDIKKTGTYALTILIPYIAKFYTTEDIAETQMVKSGKIIDAAKAKELLVEIAEDKEGVEPNKDDGELQFD
jgi:hypothetical protein